MLKYIKTLIIILFIISPLSLNVKAADITDINNLIENAKGLDGQEVTVQGEAIGESMDRGDYSWVNINDGTNAIGIWLIKNEAEKVTNFGSYKYKGDVLKITGIFHRACNEHGGEADLHCNSIEIVKEGYPVKEQIAPAKIITTTLLTAFAILFLLFLFKTIEVKAKET